ncbi:MAG: DinB family protein [Pirellulales bacterium]
MKTHLLRMFRGMAWADRELIAAVRVAPAAQAEALPLLAHVLAAEEVWLARLEQRESRFAVWPTIAIDDCQQVADDNAACFARFVERTNESALTALVHYQNQTGRVFDTPVIDILTHVVIHGAYHRGQIAKILARHGAASPNTDFITFVREIEPEAPVDDSTK